MGIEYWVEMVGQVERRLNDGWELYGNPFLSSDGCVLQAMTRKDKPTQPEQPTEFRRGQIVMVSSDGDHWYPMIFCGLNNKTIYNKYQVADCLQEVEDLDIRYPWKYCRLPTQQELTGDV